MRLRQATRDDATALVALFETLYAETNYMLMEPGEADLDAWVLADRIEKGARTQAEIWFVSAQGGGVNGFIHGRRGLRRRNHHSLYLVMGVRKAAWGNRIGTGLLEAIEHWARVAAIHRLELTVNATNQRAIRAYARAGFVCEGTKRDSLLIEGKYVDETYMSKLLSS